MMEEKTVSFERLLEEVRELFSLPPCEAELSIVGEEEIRQLNRENRGVDRITDVLSFPALEAKEGVLSYAPYDWNPETGKLMLGDVILCREQAIRQAQEFGHSTEREIGYLEVHSLLHLVGFDHELESDRAKMREKEEQILRKVGLVREE